MSHTHQIVPLLSDTKFCFWLKLKLKCIANNTLTLKHFHNIAADFSFYFLILK